MYYGTDLENLWSSVPIKTTQVCNSTKELLKLITPFEAVLGIEGEDTRALRALATCKAQLVAELQKQAGF